MFIAKKLKQITKFVLTLYSETVRIIVCIEGRCRKTFLLAYLRILNFVVIFPRREK